MRVAAATLIDTNARDIRANAKAAAHTVKKRRQAAS